MSISYTSHPTPPPLGPFTIEYNHVKFFDGLSLSRSLALSICLDAAYGRRRRRIRLLLFVRVKHPAGGEGGGV